MLEIVPATPTTDFRAVAQLYFDTWRASYRRLVPQGFLDSLTPETWHPEKRQANTLLAMLDGKMIGVSSFGAGRYPDYSGLGELYSLYVRPGQQHQGVGRALLLAALTRLDAGYQESYLVVLTDNVPAQRLYQSVGFIPTADRRVEQTPYGTLRERVYRRSSR